MTIRVFLGIGLAPNVRQTLTRCCDAIRAQSIPWRAEKWVPEENLHVTLKFLGAVPDEALTEIERAVSRSCEQMQEYQLTVDDVSAVPRLRSASMLWATVSEGTDETTALAAELERRLSAVGYDRSERPFKTHITLARARKPRAMPFEVLDDAHRLLYAADERDVRMSVRGVTLYSSTLTPLGPVYEELSFVPFPGD